MKPKSTHEILENEIVALEQELVTTINKSNKLRTRIEELRQSVSSLEQENETIKERSRIYKWLAAIGSIVGTLIGTALGNHRHRD